MGREEDKHKEILGMLDEIGSFSKNEQRFLICLRIRGKIEGKDGMGCYRDRQFFPSMKTLVEAGWAKKKVKINDKGKSCSYYVLTSKGIKFNAMMMKHPAYKPVWDKMEHRIAIGERILP